MKEFGQPKCFLSISSRVPRKIVEKIERAVRDATFTLASLERESRPEGFKDFVIGEIARSDCVIVEISHMGSFGEAFELGVAEAMRKPVILISADRMSSDAREIPAVVLGKEVFYISNDDPHGEVGRLTRRLQEIRTNPANRSAQGPLYSPFFVDWDRLDRADAENLCRELMAQMGFLRLDWFKHSREIDLVAELPKKDPDGFEYRELWLVAMGHNAPIEHVFDMAVHDPEMFIDRFIRRSERLESLPLNREDIPLTLLFVTLEDGTNLIRELEEAERRIKVRRRNPNAIRIRHWDRPYLTNLVQQFPQLGYKYFSDEARARSKYRKSPDELYRETVRLNDRLAATNKALEDEKNARVRAERDAVWKDISFAAAHRMGNPIFAIETVLDSLTKRIKENRSQEAVDVVNRIRVSVDKAKDIVDQFKSLTRAQEINALPCHLLPILTSACQPVLDQGGELTIRCAPEVIVMGDSARLTEVFDELAANALKWIDGQKKEITVTVISPNKAPLPASVDSSRSYALIHFSDNGPGVAVENKGRIFHAFFTTHDHGTGLGLALARRVIEGHGGVILESGVPGKGADFEIYLPLPSAPPQPENSSKTKKTKA